jgi:hypothetical protein
MRFLWPYRVPYSMMTLLCGRKGSMKGLLAMHITANMAIKTGGSVLWCETEDPEAQVLKPRAIAAGLSQEERERFIIMRPWEYHKVKNRLGDFIREHDIRLVVMSPLISFLQEAGDYNQENQVRPELEKIQEAIEPYECAFIGIMHPNKKGGGYLTALERVMGASAFVNYVRSVLIVDWDKVEERPRLMHAAINLTSRDDDLLLELVNKNALGDGNERGPFVAIQLHEAEDNADVDAALDRKASRENEADAKLSASQWIIQQLESSEAKSLTTDELQTRAKDDGYSWESVKKTSRRLKNKGDIDKEPVGPGVERWLRIF